jgi:hypothetical protein
VIGLGEIGAALEGARLLLLLPGLRGLTPREAESLLRDRLGIGKAAAVRLVARNRRLWSLREQGRAGR